MQKRNVDSNQKRLHTTKNACFSNKTSHFRVIARSAATWQSLSRRHGIPWRGTGAANDKNPEFLIRPAGTPHRHFLRSAISRGRKPAFHMRSIFHTIKDRISLRSLAVPRSGMANRSVKDCRVGRKKCALLAMTNLIGFAGK